MRRRPDSSTTRQSRRPIQSARPARQARRSTVELRRSSASHLSLGDLVALLHDRALGRGLSEDEAAAATARGVAVALEQPANRRLLGELSQA